MQTSTESESRVLQKILKLTGISFVLKGSELNFEEAIQLRDRIKSLEKEYGIETQGTQSVPARGNAALVNLIKSVGITAQ